MMQSKVLTPRKINKRERVGWFLLLEKSNFMNQGFTSMSWTFSVILLPSSLYLLYISFSIYCLEPLSQSMLDNNNVPVDDETQKYVGGTEHFKTRYNAHTRSFRIRDPKIQTSLSNYIWSLKYQDINHVVTWQILEKSRVFNPITMQCLICLSESVKILDPNLASINTRNEIYGFCRHRKKYLLKYAKPLALKGDALTYRYWMSHFVYCNSF